MLIAQIDILTFAESFFVTFQDRLRYLTRQEGELDTSDLPARGQYLISVPLARY